MKDEQFKRTTSGDQAEHPLVSIRNFSIYSILSILQKASSFLLLPLYTFYLSPDDFGIVAVVTAIATIVPPLVMLNTNEFVYFTTLKRDQGWEREVSSILCFQLLIVGIVFILGLLGLWIWWGKELFMFGVPFFPYLFYAIGFAVLSSIFTSYSLLLQGMNDVKSFSRLNVSFSILFAALVVILLLLEMKAMSFIYANLVLYTLFGGVSVLLMRRRFGLALHWQDVRQGLRYAVPLVPHTLSHWGKGYLDRVFLSAFISMAAAGLYHFAITLGSVLTVGLEAFVKVNNPFFFAQFEDPARRDSIISRLHLAAAFFSILGIALSFFSREWMWFFDDKYAESHLLLPFVVTGNLLYLIYLGIVNVLFIKKKTFVVSMLTSSSGVVASIGSYYLIRTFGLNGAAISHVFSNGLIALIVYVGVQRVDSVNWRLFQLLFMLGLPSFGIVINQYSWGLTSKIGVSILCVGAVLFLVRVEVRKTFRAFGIDLKIMR